MKVKRSLSWIGVALDGTLSVSVPHGGMLEIGPAIPRMVEQVRIALSKGYTVKIFTERVSGAYSDNINAQMQASAVSDAVARWTKDVFGFELEATAVKDKNCYEIWDSKAREVLPNQGFFLREAYGAQKNICMKMGEAS